MKSLILLINFVLINYTFANDWNQITSVIELDTNNCEIQSLISDDNGNCYAVVENCLNEPVEISWKLLKTTDKGITWNLKYLAPSLWEQEAPIILSIEEAISPSPDYIYLASNSWSVLLKSTDGGNTFQKIILDTTDYGPNWTVRAFAMYDTSFGFVVNSYSYFTTKDGWKTFEKYPKLNKDQTYYTPVFLDSNTVVMTYHANYRWNDGKGLAFVKYHLNEDKWDTLYFFHRDSIFGDHVGSLQFLNDTLAYGCGTRYFTDESNGKGDLIYKTTDGGNSWKVILSEIKTPPIGFDNNISFYDEKNGIAVGHYGKIAMTNDGGETWVYEELPNAMDHCPKMIVCWAGRYPLIGTWVAGIFRYEGDFFGFPPPPVFPKIMVSDVDLGKVDIMSNDTLSHTLNIYNISDTLDLKITSYSALTEKAFFTDLPIVDSINPIVIKPQQSFEFNVFFKPDEVKKYRDSIIFFSGAHSQDSIALISGEGFTYPSIQVEDFNFGKCQINKKDSLSTKIRITNTSELTELIITGHSSMLEKAFSTDLPIINRITPLIINPEEYYEFTAYFHPYEVRKFRDSIRFISKAKGFDNMMHLSGEGIDTTTSINDKTNGFNINVYNNENQLYISIKGPHFRRYKLQICDIYGHIVKEAKLNSGIGTLYKPVDISGLTNGAYLYLISYNGIIAKTGKFIVNK